MFFWRVLVLVLLRRESRRERGLTLGAPYFDTHANSFYGNQGGVTMKRTAKKVLAQVRIEPFGVFLFRGNKPIETPSWGGTFGSV